MLETLFLALIFSSIKGCICDCVCVPFWNCNEGSSSEDVLGMLGVGQDCPGYFDVCCKIKCGQRKGDNLPFADMIRQRILGTGNEANFAEFPWMLAVLHDHNYRCGASLIHPKVALTAAHCVQAGGLYRVRAGEWDWTSTREPMKHQDRTVKTIITHPDFNGLSLINDIALLIIDRSFELTDHIGIACLPRQNAPLKTQECIITGWGKTSHKSTKHYVAILNKANLPVVSNDKCMWTLQRQLGLMFRLHDSFLCAGGELKDTCKGDGGSPLMCLVDGDEDRYEQFGIMSWGLICGLYEAPGVYVNVARFTDWIDQQLKNFKLDHEIYKY